LNFHLRAGVFYLLINGYFLLIWKGEVILDDRFTLFNLKVEVVSTEKPMVCSHNEGDYFLVEGENLIFPDTNSFSMYALSAIMPLLPAKQRPLHRYDWMLSDSFIACPDPNCGAKFKITRTRTQEFSHAECTIEPIQKGDGQYNGRTI
jgi:uncharacterized repeat protein (TIGR04076 family)